MIRNFARALLLVLNHEGGWADNPKDPGGATMKGITIATYRKYINAKGTKADLRAITPEQISDIYRKSYWDAIGGDTLPDGLDYATFDFAVNSGPSRAAKYLQAAVGTKQDGRIGAETLTAIQEHPAARLVNALCDSRLVFMRKIKAGDGQPLWDTFGKGWTKRVAECRKEALIMVAAQVAVPVQPVPAPIPAPEPPKPVVMPPEPVPEPQVVHVTKDGKVEPGPAGPYVERNPFWLVIWAFLRAIFGGKKP